MSVAEDRHDVRGRTVLLRGDFRNGVERQLADAVFALAQEGARIAVVGALGEPGGEFHPMLSLEKFSQPLAAMSGVPVSFIPDSVGATAESRLAQVPFGAAALMENVRFHPQERRDSRAFALRLSCLADFFADCGAAPEKPLAWHAEIATLMPAPPIALHQAEKEGH